MPSQIETKGVGVQAAQWTTAYVDSLPDSSFGWIDKNGGRHLPYKDKDGKVDLPHVRNALARLNQVQGMSDEERSKVRTKLQNALKDVKAADDISFRSIHAIQADNSVEELPQEIMLLREGTFRPEKYEFLGPIPVTADDLREYKANFDRGIGMADSGQTGLPVDYGHKSGENAAAWIKAMNVRTDTEGVSALWSTRVEYSKSGREAILGKEYKCISADFYPKALGDWVDPESGVVAQNVIVGAGLTNRPMFSGNKPVIASELEAEATGVKTVIYVNATSEIKEKRMNLDQLRIKAAEDLTGAEGIFLAQRANDLSEDERKKFGIEAAAPAKETPKVVKAAAVTGSEGTVAVEASELKAQNDKIALQAAELQAQTEKVKNLEASVGELQATAQAAHKKDIEQFVDAQITRGAIVADQKDKWVGSILADEHAKELLEALPGSKLLGTKLGSALDAATLTASEEQVKKAKELMASDSGLANKGIQAAMAKVAEQDPDLAQRVLDERRSLAGIRAAA